MTHSHAHSHSLSGPAPLGPLAAKIVVGLLIVIGVAVLAGAALLWPSQQKVDIPLPFQNAAGGAVTTEAGHVLSSSAATCGSPSVGAVLTADPVPAQGDGAACVQTLIAIDSGPNKGANTLLEFSGGPGQPHLAVGDHIRISRQVDPTGTTTYSFYDYERTWPLIALAAVFAIVVVAVARWRGLRALIGIVVAFARAGGVPAARPARRRRRHSGRAGGVGGDPVRGDLPGARREPAHQRGAARHARRRCCSPRYCPGAQSNWRT